MSKKVLIISHGVISKTTNGGKTLLNLFNGWDKFKIAQLYFNPEIPDNNLCVNYFRVMDKEVLGSVFGNKKEIGKILNEEDIQFDISDNRITSPKEEKLHTFARKRRSYIYVLRNLIWKFGKWNNSKLDAWIKKFKPEAIFYVAGSFTYSYDIAIYISERYKVPLISYFSDDYYINSPFSFTPLGIINKIMFNRKIKKIIRKSKTYLCINEKMANDYEIKFNKSPRVIMTPFTEINEYNRKKSVDTIKIVYAGNVNLNRHEPVIRLANALALLNNNSQRIELIVYSGLKDQKMIRKLELAGIDFRGKINQNELINIYNSSDYLLHVESFKKKYISKTMYSTSTKIPDLLNSGTPIIAIGPNSVASIEYLEKESAAFIISNKNFGVEEIVRIMNSDSHNKIIMNAKTLAIRNHSPIKITKSIINIIDQN